MLPESESQNAQPDVVDVTTADGVVTARIMAGTVEEHNAATVLEALREAIDQVGGKLTQVVLDLGSVTFVNSSGLSAFIEIRTLADEHGAATIVYRVTEEVDRLFKMLRIDRLYTFVDSADALSELHP